MTLLVGDYEYSGCEIDGVKYSVIKNGGRIERVRRVEPDGNRIIWQDGDQMTSLILSVVAAARAR